MKRKHIDEVYMVEIGTRLARVRKSRGLTRKRLSEISGISDETIRQIENNGGLPNIKTLCKICGALGIKAEEVIPESMYEVKR